MKDVAMAWRQPKKILERHKYSFKNLCSTCCLDNFFAPPCNCTSIYNLVDILSDGRMNRWPNFENICSNEKVISPLNIVLFSNFLPQCRLEAHLGNFFFLSKFYYSETTDFVDLLTFASFPPIFFSSKCNSFMYDTIHSFR